MTSLYAISSLDGKAAKQQCWNLLTLEASLARLVAQWATSEGQAQVLGTFCQREVRLRTARTTLADVCTHLQQMLPLTLVTMVALDDRARTGCYHLRYIFGLGKSRFCVSIETEIPDGSEDQRTYQSITPAFPAANWYEREARDLFGLIPLGHPDPRRLVLHRHWPDEVRPMHRDVPLTAQPPFLPDEEEFRNRTCGEGLLEIPVGPIHAGIIEPGHFRFSAVGEHIVNLEARLFYTHRGIEKCCEELPVERALFLIERICAACTISSTLAYCQALESLAQTGPALPARAAYLRVIYAELERLYNHIGDIGNICAGIGFHTGAQSGAWLKETLLRTYERMLGSRYLFGLITLGGVKRDLSDAACSMLQETLEQVQREFHSVLRRIRNNEWVMERFTGTGILTKQTAHDLGAVGVAARASGIDRDSRRDTPYAAYEELQPETIPTLLSGDVAARLLIRAEEVNTSFKLLFTALQHLPQGPLAVPLGELPAYESAWSLTESARGTNCHWVMTGPGNTLYRYRIRTASYANWPLVLRAALNNIVPDFPLINKSFELCYSCLDR
jgi:Ni,Fe-hydrogenase III large subunit/Ni,Fe-hydrogenase III component G